jgi:hypothetical protein
LYGYGFLVFGFLYVVRYYVQCRWNHYQSEVSQIPKLDLLLSPPIGRGEAAIQAFLQMGSDGVFHSQAKVAELGFSISSKAWLFSVILVSTYNTSLLNMLRRHHIIRTITWLSCVALVIKLAIGFCIIQELKKKKYSKMAKKPVKAANSEGSNDNNIPATSDNAIDIEVGEVCPPTDKAIDEHYEEENEQNSNTGIAIM